MQLIRQLHALRGAVAALCDGGGRIALVPTMGALHAGHMSLVSEARRRAEHVIASVFVNPTQFAAGEDFARYPRREAADARALEEAGVAVLWMPDAGEMYPAGHASRVVVEGPALPLEGSSRPGHFSGVATVVAKLFNQVRPDLAVFGEKDWQQLAVIRRMAVDLDFDVEIVGVPIEREDDGLALSSRNMLLDEAERLAARVLPRTLGEAAAAIAGGAEVEQTLAQAKRRLADAGLDPIDYLDLRHEGTLEPLASADPAGRLFAAARLGRTRLIDNLPLA